MTIFDKKLVLFPALMIVTVLFANASHLHAEPNVTFFRVNQTDGKWKLLDPSGKSFYMRGANHYGDGSGMPWNLDQKNGSTAAWRESLRDRNAAWGFNYHYTHNPLWHPQATSFDLWIDDITKPGTADRTTWIRLTRQIYGSVDRWTEVYGIPIQS